MARRALDLRNLVRVRIRLDCRVAGIARKAAMNTGAKLIAIHRETVASGVFHVLVGVTGEAFGLRPGARSRNRAEQRRESDREDPTADSGVQARADPAR